ncbi:MAG: dethiobiotin synthase [Gammaproteobacteria bacterium]
MRGLFVTGTDTGVGKTCVATGLVRACVRAGLLTVGMKPVASGCVQTPDGLRNEDALALQAAANLPRPYELVNPYAFAPPIAPHIAAREAGVKIELRRILSAFEQLCADVDAVVVEGVGGWQVPLAENFGLPDLARALALPVILVVGLRLGCLNHALLSARAIRADGLTLAGWVANGIDPNFERRAENLAVLMEVADAPPLAEISWQPGATVAAVAAQLNASEVMRILDNVR